MGSYSHLFKKYPRIEREPDITPPNKDEEQREILSLNKKPDPSTSPMAAAFERANQAQDDNVGNKVETPKNSRIEQPNSEIGLPKTKAAPIGINMEKRIAMMKKRRQVREHPIGKMPKPQTEMPKPQTETTEAAKEDNTMESQLQIVESSHKAPMPEVDVQRAIDKELEEAIAIKDSAVKEAEKILSEIKRKENNATQDIKHRVNKLQNEFNRLTNTNRSLEAKIITNQNKLNAIQTAINEKKAVDLSYPEIMAQIINEPEATISASLGLLTLENHDTLQRIVEKSALDLAKRTKENAKKEMEQSLRDLRAKYGLSQEELVAMLGIQTEKKPKPTTTDGLKKIGKPKKSDAEEELTTYLQNTVGGSIVADVPFCQNGRWRMMPQGAIDYRELHKGQKNHDEKSYRLNTHLTEKEREKLSLAIKAAILRNPTMKTAVLLYHLQIQYPHLQNSQHISKQKHLLQKHKLLSKADAEAGAGTATKEDFDMPFK